MSTILNYQQSHLDLNKVESINKSQLVDLINNFMISYLDKLKSLISNVDSRLFKLNSKIITCQSNLCILESRISSIPGLNLDDFNKSAIDLQSDGRFVEQNADQTDQPANLDSQRSIDEQQQTQTDSNEEAKEDGNELNDNPELIRFKKMLTFGVPKAAVQQKMRSEGYDPNLLK